MGILASKRSDLRTLASWLLSGVSASKNARDDTAVRNRSMGWASAGAERNRSTTGPCRSRWERSCWLNPANSATVGNSP